jgi:hypothetical protein
MTQKSILRLLLPIAVISFMLGLLSVLVLDTPGADDVSASPSALVSALSDNPDLTTLLILGIDQMGESNPRLLAVWWVSFDLTGGEISVFGIPIDASLPGSSHPPLMQAFELKNDHSPSQAFLSALASVSPQYPDVVVVLDEAAFSQLIDFMGGVWLEGTVFNGQDILSALHLVYDEPGLLISMQASILLSLSYQSSELEEHPEITQLTELIPAHAYTSIPPTTLVNLLIPLLPLDPNSINIQVWSLNQLIP